MTEIRKNMFMETVVTVAGERARARAERRPVHADILRPGKPHSCLASPRLTEICTFSLMRPEFVSDYEDALFKRAVPISTD